jgi:hypothetical protein
MWREEITGEWRKLHNEEVHNLYSSPHIIRAIKSTRIGWMRRVAVTEETRNAYKILSGIWGKEDTWKASVNGRKISYLKWILKKWGVGLLLDLSGDWLL